LHKFTRGNAGRNQTFDGFKAKIELTYETEAYIARKSNKKVIFYKEISGALRNFHVNFQKFFKITVTLTASLLPSQYNQSERLQITY